ncbi:hypothetical protein [Clostridium cadaveris]|uniref:hypothetical protein n=1 Tax=Clostridium cadaveris TaxID=1529 RepID=UPI003992ECC9
MEGKNFYAGYLKAISYMERSSVMVRSLDCLDFNYDGDIERSIIKYLTSRYYDFGMSPEMWEKYPDGEFKRIVEETKLNIEVVEEWKEGLQKFLENSFPNVYGNRIGEQNGEIIKIDNLDELFILNIEEEINETSLMDECGNLDQSKFVKAYRFGREDYAFIRYCFAWNLIDTFIIIIGNKGYIMYFGFDD